MKDIRPALRALLLSDPTVNTLVGGVRIHTMRVPQNQVEPSVVMNRISESGDYNMASDSGLGNIRMQLDSWAQTPDQATELANAVYDKLSGFKGVVVYNSEALEIQGTFVTSGIDGYDEVTKLARVGRDYRIWYVAR